MLNTIAALRKIAVLGACSASQCAFIAGIALANMLGGIAAERMSPWPILASAPLFLLSVAPAVSALPVAKFMAVFGRKPSVLGGLSLGAAGAVSAAIALFMQSLLLLFFAFLLLGITLSVNGQLRFIAGSARPDRLEFAVGTVLLGGLSGGLLGAQFGGITATGHAFAMLLPLYCAAFLAVALVRMPPPAENKKIRLHAMRALRRPPVFAACAAGASGNAVNLLLVVAAPIAMHNHGAMSMAQVALALQTGCFMMYAPPLLCSGVMRRIGPNRLLAGGGASVAAAVLCGLFAPGAVGYIAAVGWAGLSWSLLHVGSTVTLARMCGTRLLPSAQAASESVYFTAGAIAVLISGAIVTTCGWDAVLWTTAPLALVAPLALFWTAPPVARQNAG